VEVNGPGGIFLELGRIFSLGPPPQQLQDAMGTAVEAQNVSLNLLKPGADPADLLRANNEFLESKGYFPEARLYAHGQGYDLVERPLIREDEHMKIAAGMNITVHPTAANKTVWAGVTDNYMVGEDGPGECLHTTPKKIFVL
jgi:Xaa-Pro aminopeptidase